MYHGFIRSYFNTHSINLYLTMNYKINSEILKACEVQLCYRPKVKISDRPHITSSKDIYLFLKENQIFDPNTVEHREFFKILFLNSANRLLGVMHHTEGTLMGTPIDIRHIMQAAILANAKCLILVHNHPSGLCTPSVQDDSITLQIKNACKFFEMQILDHLIISQYSYYSYADNGRIF